MRPPGTLRKRLRIINQKVDTHFKHVSRHLRVSMKKHKNMQEKKLTIVMWFQILIEWKVCKLESCKDIFGRSYQKKIIC